MHKIIIEVRGGLVQAVHSNNKNINVRVLDWDNTNSQNMKFEDKQMMEEIKFMKDIL